MMTIKQRIAVSLLSFCLVAGSNAPDGYHRCGKNSAPNDGATCLAKDCVPGVSDYACGQGESCFRQHGFCAPQRELCKDISECEDGGLPTTWNQACSYFEDTKAYCSHDVFRKNCCFCGGGQCERASRPPSAEPTPPPTDTPAPRVSLEGKDYNGALQLTGYWENWENVLWWDTQNPPRPGKCFTGCVIEEEALPLIEPYTAMNYAFVILTSFLDFDQTSCDSCLIWNSGYERSGDVQDVCCPVFGNDGDRFYNARYKGKGLKNGGRGESSIVVDWRDLGKDPILNADAGVTGGRGQGVVNVGDFCRLVRSRGKRCIVALGGWSDWTRVGNNERADKIARLAAELVLWSFADGVDLDFEHLYEFDDIWPGEYDAFAHMTNRLRFYLDNYVRKQWFAALAARKAFIGSKAGPWFDKWRAYIGELQTREPPKHFTLSFTTRFNAWVDPEDKLNYIVEGSYRPKYSFGSANEGRKIWDACGDAIDQVNIMAYDASADGKALELDFEQIARNFVAGGVPKHKIVMGFEPVGRGRDWPGRVYDDEQAAGGRWEGEEVDLRVSKFLADGCYGGAMTWAVNEPIGLKYRNGKDLMVPLMADIAKIFDSGRAQCKSDEPNPVPTPKPTPSKPVNKKKVCKQQKTDEKCEGYSYCYVKSKKGGKQTCEVFKKCTKLKSVDSCDRFSQCKSILKKRKFRKCTTSV